MHTEYVKKIVKKLWNLGRIQFLNSPVLNWSQSISFLRFQPHLLGFPGVSPPGSSAGRPIRSLIGITPGRKLSIRRAKVRVGPRAEAPLDQ